MTSLAHTWFMVVRQTRNLMREPIWIALLLIQPMIWLALYGQLFKHVVHLGGFGTTGAGGSLSADPRSLSSSPGLKSGGSAALAAPLPPVGATTSSTFTSSDSSKSPYVYGGASKPKDCLSKGRSGIG